MQNITWGNIRQIEMFIFMVVKMTNHTVWLPRSPDTLWVLLHGSAPESTFFWPNRPCLIIRVLVFIHQRLYLSYNKGVLLTTLVPFELVKHKFPNWIMLHIYRCRFLITHGTKQCTTIHYLAQLVFNHDLKYLQAANQHVTKYSKSFDHLCDFWISINFRIVPCVCMCACQWIPVNRYFDLKTHKRSIWNVEYLRLIEELIWGHRRSS